jgi:PTS system mannose-specific IIA component
MSISLLIISHDDIGDALLASAIGILGLCPLRTATLAVSAEDSLESIDQRAQRLLEELQDEDGTLVLTDLLGSTPSNVAARLEQAGRVRVVAGLNLPMLIRVLSHSGDDLQGLVELAIDGGRRGVVQGRIQSHAPLVSIDED